LYYTKPEQLLTTIDGLFIKNNTTKIIKIKYQDLPTFFKTESLSQNQYTAFTQVFVDTSFELLSFLALNFSSKPFLLSMSTLNLENYLTNIQPVSMTL
jgi:hypothetical protein